MVVSFVLADDAASWQAGVAEEITRVMTEACHVYNAGPADFEKAIRCSFMPHHPTAQGSSAGTIDFGRSRSVRVALHEIGHCVGIGQVRQPDTTIFPFSSPLLFFLSALSLPPF
jgi:hypothetical protein